MKKAHFWLSVTIPVIIDSFFLPKIIDVKSYLLSTFLYLFLFVPVLIRFLLKRDYIKALILALSIQLGAVIVGNTPEVIYKTRLHEKTYGEMAKFIKRAAGDETVYIFRPDDYLRGSVSFYNNCLTPELDTQNEVLEVFGKKRGFFILAEEEKIRKLKENREIDARCSIVQMPDFHYKARYGLLSCR